MCDVAALSLCHRSWDAPGLQPGTKLRTFYYRWIPINSNLGVFVKARIHQSFTSILPPLATGHRDICFLLFFFLTHLSEKTVILTTRWAPECPVPQEAWHFFLFHARMKLGISIALGRAANKRRRENQAEILTHHSTAYRASHCWCTVQI